jgi:hypothetical protein
VKALRAWITFAGEARRFPAERALLFGKFIHNGVTVAAAVQDYTVRFGA